MMLTLSILSLLSLAAVAGLLVYVTSLRREIRDRADARVAALAAAIHDGDMPPEEPRHGEALLFGARADADRPSAAPPWGVRAAGAALVVLVLLVLAVFSRAGGRPGSGADGAPATDTPIELLSLRHHRDAKGLTVSGLVRNPPGAPVRRDTDAVVFTFDASGAFVASGRAALADRALASGAGSPFSVTIPDGLQVSRYRVSFRSGVGVLPHVDRRLESGPGGAQP